MRTRFFEQMTEQEVRDYLKKNDIILLPVGVVEMHGEMPLGCEHVLPLAFADRIAEEVDGLVLTGLVHFFAGATAIGKGTINVRPSIGAAYLKDIFRCLWGNGFRRIICLTAHGPAQITVNNAVREYFDETRHTVAYVDLDGQFGRVRETNPKGADFNKLIWGAYAHLGRLDEIKMDQKPIKKAPPPLAVQKLQQKRVGFGYAFADISHHGWWPEKRALTEGERLARAEEGLTQMESVLKVLNARELVQTLRDVQQYHKTKVGKQLA